MTGEERLPTEAELREAELLARALEEPVEPGRDLAPVDDALGAATLVRAARFAGLGELRARAALERAWPERARPIRARAIAAALAAAAAAFVWFVLRPRGPAQLPAPGVQLLRAQLAAARPAPPAALARLDAEMAAYRKQVYASLGRAYGGRR
jgi:hypothetical protein